MTAVAAVATAINSSDYLRQRAQSTMQAPSLGCLLLYEGVAISRRRGHMPLTIKNEQDKFKFKVNDDGLPLGKVIKLGGSYWISCCPLCGHAHEIGQQHSGEF